ncbi:MAG: 1-acyl-sn-glycerol-3-phosphate acyltransferase [Gammaproteobacteria bacterium]
MWSRRLVTIPVFLLATTAVTLLLPLLVTLALIITPLPGLRGAVPTTLFIVGYLWCESIGVVSAGWIALRHRGRDDFLRANYRLQCWWASALMHIAKRLYRLHFDVTGTEALRGAPGLMLPRHTSIADTIIPMVFYAVPQQVRLRYVLKRELLIDPCLDIVGNRLPNLFVDRSGQDSERARQDVAKLVANLGPDEGVLIYPEGTRFSRARHQALMSRYAASPDMLAQLARWPDLLPPRLGGTMALLAANPGRDLVFCAHTGFEGSSHFSTLVNGAWRSAHVRIHFWRVPFADIPTDRASQVAFLQAEWDRMQAWLAGAGGAPRPARADA